MLRRLFGRPKIVAPASETINSAHGSLDQAYSWGYSAGKIDAAGKAWEHSRRGLHPIWATMGDDYLAAANVGYDRGCEDGISVSVGLRPTFGRPPWRDAEAARLKAVDAIRSWRETTDRLRESNEQMAAALSAWAAGRQAARWTDDAAMPEPV
jgi:hypothetical protein